MTTCLVICDWLDVTTHPDSDIADKVLRFASTFATDFISEGKVDSGSVSVRTSSGGVLRVDKRRNHSRISASGIILSELRFLGLFGEYLDILGSGPHRVTRLDAAYDTDEDGADVFARLKRRYRKDLVMLTRKGLKPRFMSQFRESDGRESGTFYAGYRSGADITGRVYDKALEILQRTGATDGKPLSRYELTVRSTFSPSLRDASEPERIFWHFMAPALVCKPKGLKVAPWESGWGGDWTSVKRSDTDPASAIRFLLEGSTVLERLELLADELGPNGRQYLRGQLNKRFSDLS